MQDLRLVGVHDDGTHLLLEDADGSRWRLPLDDALRAAVRQDRSRLGQLQIELDGGLRPRDVQALVRAGATADDVAARAGWTVEKVRRYEGPILAERAHVADLARAVQMRTRAGGSDAPTLATRVGERMRARDVDPTTSTWDSWRDAEAEHWTVALRFAAGGRERRALWSFELATQTVTPLDDEARWLTAEETPAAPGPLPAPAARVQTTVYDVEAEGGVAATTRAPHPSPTRASAEPPVDLVTAMRERSQARGRRSRKGRAPTDVPAPETPTDALPITGLTYDPAVHGLPPAAHPRQGGELELGLDEGAGETGSGASAEASPAPTTEVDGPGGDAADDAADHRVDDVEQPAVGEVGAGDEPAVAEGAAEGDDREGTDVDAPAAAPRPAPPRPKAPEPEELAPEEPEPQEPEPQEPAAAETARPAARRGRPQVPSWDDIMFGSRRD